MASSTLWCPGEKFSPFLKKKKKKPFSWLTLNGSDTWTSGFSRRPSQIIIRGLKSPTGRPRGTRPPTYRPGFNVAMKETFYCRLQTAALSQLCVVHAIICEGRRGLVLIRAVKWRRSDRLLTSVEAEFTELAERARALVTRRDANTKERMLDALLFHMTCHQQQLSLGSQRMFAVCKPTCVFGSEHQIHLTSYSLANERGSEPGAGFQELGIILLVRTPE